MILVDTAGCKVPVTGTDSIKVFEVFASFTNPGHIRYAIQERLHSPIPAPAMILLPITFGLLVIKQLLLLPIPVHNYTATGNYTAKLFITSKNGCKDSVTMTSQ